MLSTVVQQNDILISVHTHLHTRMGKSLCGAGCKRFRIGFFIRLGTERINLLDPLNVFCYSCLMLVDIYSAALDRATTVCFWVGRVPDSGLLSTFGRGGRKQRLSYYFSLHIYTISLCQQYALFTVGLHMSSHFLWALPLIYLELWVGKILQQTY